MTQTIDQIAHTAEEVVKSMTQVVHFTDQLAGETQDLMHHLLDTRAQIDGELKRIDVQVGEWQQHLSAVQVQIEQVEGLIREAGTQADHTLLELSQEVQSGFTQTQGVLTQWYQVVAKGAQDVTASAGQLAGQVTEVTQVITDQQHQVDAGFSQSEQQMGQLVQEMAGLQRQLDSYLQQMQATVQQQEAQFTASVQHDVVEPCHSVVQTHGEFLNQLGQGIASVDMQHLQQEAQDVLTNQAMQTVNELLQEVIQKFDSIAQDILDVRNISSDERAVLDPMVKALQELLQPLEETVSNVKNIAGTVGVSL